MSEEKKVPKALLDSYTRVVGGYAKDVLNLSEADVEKGLMGLANKWAGCYRCAYSRAHPDTEKESVKKHYLDLRMRTCALGLAQGDCGECYSPFV